MSIKLYLRDYNIVLKDTTKNLTSVFAFNMFDDNMKPLIKWIDEDCEDFYILYQDVNTKKYYLFEGFNCPSYDNWIGYKYNNNDSKFFNEYYIDEVLGNFVVYDNLSNFKIDDYWRPEWKEIVKNFLNHNNIN